ncbi:hypothetical protein [Rhizobium leguminosarum]|uniref:hypothetical protein n=1 Tax=Rhizobium leguminosarum TaxID=384 RepID=UPI001C924430|nr:hypothetical protein [Rhizobium leguminosarum]MBY2914669.1 hypothetical protein [Rhizobium leguminosarum]MBY2970208.1 hypothetical protein [Rhizobium leguminosarum]MBY2977581.1 hypothetical protein [Rhizobium leguminosarum]MBY2999177.1 hypothetical protein [Rhizobium leguminosarum]MBY3006131.1 hypothetical protein [Rhizobium leguminosarum]
MRDEVAAHIEPRLLFRYLANNGWKVDPAKNSIRRAWLPEDGENESVEIFISESSRQNRDVFFAINTLSQLYDEPSDHLISDIRSLAYDVITSKIPSEYVRNDSIELRIASQYIEKMKVFLASSATTEISGERAYKRVLKEAVEYSEKCRFGHTFKGSFGFQIESPVGLNDEPTMLGVDQVVPFERRVIERVANGLSSFETAVKESDAGIIVAQADGFSSNMCDAIIDIIEDIEVSKIEVAIAFSPEWRSAKSAAKKEYTIEYAHLDLLREASKAMRVEEKPRDAHVVGRIKKLQADGNPADLAEENAKRQIEVSWINEENQLLNVQLLLSPEAYLAAVDAHKNGKIVSATGTLERKGRSWRLTDIKAFSIISPE